MFVDILICKGFVGLASSVCMHTYSVKIDRYLLRERWIDRQIKKKERKEESRHWLVCWDPSVCIFRWANCGVSHVQRSVVLWSVHYHAFN